MYQAGRTSRSNIFAKEGIRREQSNCWDGANLPGCPALLLLGRVKLEAGATKPGAVRLRRPGLALLQESV